MQKIKLTKNTKANNKKKPIKPSFLGRPLFGVFLLMLFMISFSSSLIIFESNRKGISTNQVLQQKVINSVKSVNEVWKPNIKTFEDRYVTFLLVGIDARDPIVKNGVIIDGKTELDELNTDTIMQVIYDMKTKNITLISIPRDIGVEYSAEDECIKQYEFKHERRSINHIYKFALMGECEEGPMNMLSKYVEKITGFEVNYNAVVTLSSFIQIVEIIGDENDEGEKGLWIEIPEAVYSYYPNEYGYHDYFTVEPGRQFLTSDELLRYSRVRIGSTDFERVRRQQVVIDALKERLTKVDTYKSPNKVVEIIDSLNSTVTHSEIGFDEIRTVAQMYDSFETSKVNKLVLDYRLGGQNKLLTIPSYTSPGIHNVANYYLIPVSWSKTKSGEDKYVDVKEYIRDQVENPSE